MTATQVFCTIALVVCAYVAIAMAFMFSDDSTLEGAGEIMFLILLGLIALILVVFLLLGAIGVVE